ncbi:MAG: peptidylprolyl isomerase, partial [Caldisericia bacterium]|nr:peptidylprolyl isomerase [Caldisericia bacterium]
MKKNISLLSILFVTILIFISLTIGFSHFTREVKAESVDQFSDLKAPDKPTISQFRQMQNEWIEFKTNYGSFVIELNPTAAPVTCLNFHQLVEAGFYNDIIFHRVIKDFMIQSGGYTANQPRDLDYSFQDEINPLELGLTDEEIIQNEHSDFQYDFNIPSIQHIQGVISMANAGSNTNSSQFFIVTKSDGTPWLNGKHTAFGKIVKGIDIVLKIENAKTNDRDKPMEDITILSAKIIEKSDHAIIITLQIGSTTADVSGKTVEISPAPYINRGRTMVPLRFLSEAFGATVHYDESSKGIVITLDKTVIALQIGNPNAMKNGKSIILDSPPQIRKNVTFVPMRFICDAFGANTEWDNDTQKIRIHY